MTIGDKAPEILGKDEQGRDIRLSDYKGRKLVLYFNPKDNTSGCTAEACSLRDYYSELQGKGYEVVGVSKDSAASHVNEEGIIEKIFAGKQVKTKEHAEQILDNHETVL